MRDIEWIFAEENHELSGEISRKFGISPITAQLLINRGCDDFDKAMKFMNEDESSFFAPTLMRDMKKAVKRTIDACRNGEKILVFGDYDVDGTSSVVMLIKTLRAIGCKCNYYIPRRLKEGYGLNCDVVRTAARDGYTLLITADCGTSNLEEIRLAGECGIEVIVLDHHLPSEQMPDAFAIVNPKRPDCTYPFKDLSASGIVYKFCSEILAGDHFPELMEELLGLAAMGTVADIAPLCGENRAIVKKGLQILNRTSNPGLNALLERRELLHKKIMPWHISFVLAPVINAEGRVHKYSEDEPDGISEVVELFVSNDKKSLDRYVAMLCEDNDKRQEIEKSIVAEAKNMIERRAVSKDMPGYVFYNAQWHPGVIGVVASKLSEELRKPVFIIGEGGRGSARSSISFDIYSAVKNCSQMMLSFGGHRHAAGFRMEPSLVEEFTDEINKYCASVLKEDDFIKKEYVDINVELSQLGPDIVNEIDMLEPFGYGNPQPVFCSSPVYSGNSPRIVGTDHLKAVFNQGNTEIQAIAFKMANKKSLLESNVPLSIIYTPQFNEWDGEKRIQLKIKDIKAL